MIPPTTQPVLGLLAHIIEERAGLRVLAGDHTRLEDRASPRALDAGFESLLDYYYFLRYDPGGPAELDALIESLLVHETYFFREPGPLNAMIDRVLVPMIDRGLRPRIWSAACSTGEEPMTVAMMLAQRRLLDRVDLVASDLSTRVLDHCRKGRYTARALRALPDSARGRWIDVDPEGSVALVRPEIVSAIDWRRVNLVDPADVAAIGSFDIVLCRNVLIYFGETTTREVVATLTKSLRPAGVLIVGISESLLRFGTSLVCEEIGGEFFYRKSPGIVP